MIDFNSLIVDRVIIHTINPKKPGQDGATVVSSDKICEIEHLGLELIRERLITAAGRNGKAFDLEIDPNITPDSFIELTKDLQGLDSAGFIERTVEIAESLAGYQTRTSIPASYLMVLDCLDNDTNMPVAIVFKAEPHKALQLLADDEHTQVALLQKVFLSPSQKLFKIGIIYRKSDDETLDINDQYGCFLYDEQFRTDNHPAEYFYKKFLGFSVGNNSKIQSQRFYEKTETFALGNVDDLETKKAIVSALKNEFSINQNDVVSPHEFAQTFIPEEGGLRDRYLMEVCHELPTAIVKDAELFKGRLKKRKMDFPSSINLTGPEDKFDDSVEIIEQEEELVDLDVNDDSYTIIKIKGRPYTNE
ncbi:MAG: nucleoid-associated protein [Saprospiraceae bacterium]|nr:nucleoid-associated protein [Saprospiraceae bacterium]